MTVQNSFGVTGVHEIPPEIVAAQIEAVVTDIGVEAAKTGMLASAEIIHAVAAACDQVGIGRERAAPFVVDPVAASMHGDPLLHPDALDAIRAELFPRATLVTPNLDEVRLLVGIEVRRPAGSVRAAKALHALGARWVLVKGGHLRPRPRLRRPVLRRLGFHRPSRAAFRHPAHPRRWRHARLGDHRRAGQRGASLLEAVAFGKRYVEQAVRHAYPLGAGVGPVSALWAARPPALDSGH